MLSPTTYNVLGWSDVRGYGARGDARLLTGAASIAAGSAALTLAGAALTAPADVGKSICVQGAGAGGGPLLTTISAVGSATTCTLAATAATAVPNAATPAGGSDCCWGTDDTAAIQAALDSGRAVVHLGDRRYYCAGTLNVPRNTALVGSWQGPPGHDMPYLVQPGGPNPVGTSGTTLFTVTGAGVASATPFATLNANSMLRGVVIYHPGQAHARAAAPVAFPWAVLLTDGSCGCVRDVELTNAYLGIRLGGPSGSVATASNRGRIDNLVGQPISVGIEVRNSYDSVRITNVHWIPLYALSDTTTAQTFTSPLLAWIKANGTGYAVYGADDFHFVNCFGYWYNTGFYFGNDGLHTTGPGSYGALTNCSFDRANNGISCAATQGAGVAVFGGMWSNDTRNIYVTGGNLSIHAAHCFNLGGTAEVTGGTLRLIGGLTDNTGGVTQSGGGLVLSGWTFTPTGTHLTVATGALGFAATGNLAKGGFGLANTSGKTGNNAISANNGTY